MKTSESIKEIATALARFQGKMFTLPKSASGYGYKYTPLDTVLDAIREPLAANDLGFIQLPCAAEPGMVGLTTRLLHVSGEWIEDTMTIPIPKVGKANEAQVYGAALTYARRYALTAMLGIASDEDIDAAVLDRSRPAARDRNVEADSASANMDERSSLRREIGHIAGKFGAPWLSMLLARHGKEGMSADDIDLETLREILQDAREAEAKSLDKNS